MAVIDLINKMKQKGMQDSEIAMNLQEQGYTPQQVQESLEKSNILPGSPTQYEENQSQEMQPSMMQAPQPFPTFALQPMPPEMQALTQPITQEMQAPQPQMPQEAGYDEYAQQGYDQYAPQQGYDQYAPQEQYEQYYPSTSETITELAEEIVDEKLRKFEKDIRDVARLKAEIDSKMRSLNDRLKRIEKIIDELQLKILRKITSYTSDLDDIKTELTATQESFSKILNPLVDKAREQGIKDKKTKGKKKSGMEHYLVR